MTIRLGATPAGLTSAHLHHRPFFTGRMPFLPPNQQCQSTATTPVFNLPHLYLAPTLGVTLFEFCLNFRQQKTRVPGYRVALFA